MLFRSIYSQIGEFLDTTRALNQIKLTAKFQLDLSFDSKLFFQLIMSFDKNFNSNLDLKKIDKINNSQNFINLSKK